MRQPSLPGVVDCSGIERVICVICFGFGSEGAIGMGKEM